MNTSELTLSQRMVSASAGALLTSLLVTPFDVVKTRMQLQNSMTPVSVNLSKEGLTKFSNGLMEHMIPSALFSKKCIKRVNVSKVLCSNRSLNTNKFFAKHSGLQCLTSFARFRCSICVHSEAFRIRHTIPSPTQAITSQPNVFKGTFHGIRTILFEEGISGLYVGLTPTLAMAIPATVLYFSAYDYLSLVLKRRTSLSDRKVAVLAGTSGRTFATMVIAPLELVRTRYQASFNISSGSVLDYIGGILRKEGINGLYKGVAPMLLRDVPFSALYWLGVEEFKKNLDFMPHTQKAFLSGALSGMISTVATMPFDVLKTRAQTSDYGTRNMVNVGQSIVREQGIKGLFAGLLPRMAKVVPSCAIMLASYEAGKRYFLVEVP